MEVAGWQRTVRLLDAATAGVEGSPRSTVREIAVTDLASNPIAVPPGLRDRTIAAVRSDRSANPSNRESAASASVVPIGRVRRTLPAWLFAAAAVAILVVGAGLFLERGRQLDAAQAETRELAAVVSQLDGILQDQGHLTAVLTSPTNAAAGSVSWGPSSGDIVVLTSALQAPPAGLVYRCWLEAGGGRTAIGTMSFSGSTAYWAGSLAGWGDGLSSGGRLGVSLEPAGGGVDAQPILVAVF